MRETPHPSNRYDALRLLFAGIVAVYHSVVLSKIDGDGNWEYALSLATELSIQGFFIISGALVFASFERAEGWMDYAGKRVRRLYPGYVTVILGPALVSLFITGALSGVINYLAANLIFLNFMAPTLPGLFDGQRFEAVNGALWTIKIEVAFYLCLPALAWPLARLDKRYGLAYLAALFGLGLCYPILINAAISNEDLSYRLARQLPGQMPYFAVGMAIHFIQTRWGTNLARGSTFLLGSALLLVSFWPLLVGIRAIGLGAIIVYLAFTPGPHMPAARYGDVSYGLYLVHFPIAQALVSFGLFKLSAPLGLVTAMVLSTLCAFLLWHLVEKPALRKNSHYRKTAQRSVQ